MHLIINVNRLQHVGMDFNNCIDDNNIDTSIDNTSIIYKSTGNYIYFDEENKYYSFIGDYCNGKYPYFLEGTKLCLRNCSEFNYVQYNGNCFNSY